LAEYKLLETGASERITRGSLTSEEQTKLLATEKHQYTGKNVDRVFAKDKFLLELPCLQWEKEKCSEDSELTKTKGGDGCKWSGPALTFGREISPGLGKKSFCYPSEMNSEFGWYRGNDNPSAKTHLENLRQKHSYSQQVTGELNEDSLKQYINETYLYGRTKTQNEAIYKEVTNKMALDIKNTVKHLQITILGDGRVLATFKDYMRVLFKSETEFHKQYGNYLDRFIKKNKIKEEVNKKNPT
jgi:hypothetical protein